MKQAVGPWNFHEVLPTHLLDLATVIPAMQAIGNTFDRAIADAGYRHNALSDYKSAAPKTDLYTNMLPLLNSGRIELLDHQRLISQLCALERRNTRGSKPTIDHPPGGHDDLANAVAGVVAVNNRYPNYDHALRGWSDDPNADRQAESARFQQARLAHFIFGLSGRQVCPG